MKPSDTPLEPEVALAQFVVGLQLEEVPEAIVDLARDVLVACIGTAIAGAREDGIAELRTILRGRGGSRESRTFLYGDPLPAHAAAQFNGTLCRALDFCDAMAPGLHLGSSVIPAACAAADLAWGCSGREFLSALVVGCEVGARLNLTESAYDGFDPTGVAAVFAATAAAARILRLSAAETRQALALAFNRCGGSFQSNVDGSLAVRLIQGWVAQAGLECAELARAGLTGPSRFLSGVYGFGHLFGRDQLDLADVSAQLGATWRMEGTVFKKYPSCGATQGMTELAIQLAEDLDLRPSDVAQVEVRLNPYCHRLVGHEFRPGENIRVDAQFSARFCTANALARRSSELVHFTPERIMDQVVQDLIPKITCVGDPALDKRGHSAVDVTLSTTDGRAERRQLDVPPGFPGNQLSPAEHRSRFEQCVAYASLGSEQPQTDGFLDAVARLEHLYDARHLTDMIATGQFGRSDAA